MRTAPLDPQDDRDLQFLELRGCYRDLTPEAAAVEIGWITGFPAWFMTQRLADIDEAAS